jgi:hypothetical protein
MVMRMLIFLELIMTFLPHAMYLPNTVAYISVLRQYPVAMTTVRSRADGCMTSGCQPRRSWIEFRDDTAAIRNSIKLKDRK